MGIEDADAIFTYLTQCDVDVTGVADFSAYAKEVLDLPDDVRSRYPFAVCFGVVLAKGVMDTVKTGPNPLYLHHYRQANGRLDRIAWLLAREIERRGYHAIPFAASQVVDWRNQRAHVSHKHIGVLAGLGWIGRNNLLVNPRFGARVRYNTVLTDMPLTASAPMERDCGKCRACIGSCPGGSIKEDPAQFDHKGCYTMITELKNKRNIGHHICGICVEACKGE